ncbi:MAG: RES family NAD+ phosphorylase [Prosthecobacter sp.]
MAAGSTRFDAALKSAPVIPVAETCHRMVALSAYEAAHPKKLLYDLGPKLSASGQRFSPPGDHAGLYVALERVTAGAEHTGSVAEWNASGGVAVVVFKFEVKLTRVLDLTDPAVLALLGITSTEVQGPWEGHRALFGKDPLTWELGRAAHASGRFDGLLFPSTKNMPDGRCLLIFTERLVKGMSEVVLFSDDGSVRERVPG